MCPKTPNENHKIYLFELSVIILKYKTAGKVSIKIKAYEEIYEWLQKIIMITT